MTSATAGLPDSRDDSSGSQHPESGRRAGLLFGISAYFMWGMLTLYFAALERAGALEIVAQRIMWSLVFCTLLLAVSRGFGRALRALRTPRLLGWLVLSTALIVVNWLCFVYAVQQGRVLEAALGYFMNPLVTVALGVTVLRERLRKLQWFAVGIGGIAVIVVSLGYGRLPWIALALALSFGLYGLVKNRVGRDVGAIESLSIETLLAAPLAGAYLILLAVIGQGTFLAYGWPHTVLLVSTGVITAIPLLCFGAAARRVPLVWLGMMQYIAPFCQFLLGVLVFGEELNASRWAGFGLIWLALSVLTVDMIRSGRRARTGIAEPA